METRQTTLAGGVTKPYTDECRLRDLYEDQNLSVDAIADELDCSLRSVWRYLRRFGIAPRTESDRAATPAQFHTRTDGYESWMDDNLGVLVHRLVAIAEWGFDAVAGGVVHHKNTHKWDNRPDNLRVFETQSKHSKHHARPDDHEDQRTLAEVKGIDNDEKQQLTFDDF